LKIIETRGLKQVLVRFMHEQTYGFPAYATGDSIDFVRPETLVPYSSSTVSAVQMINDHDFLLTLSQPLPATMHIGDVVENTTATPTAWIHNDTINRIPTRGILVTTRRKIVIENNILQRTHMTGILVNDDGSYWYESGMVRDLTIRKNNFYHCGEPVIDIHPENTELNSVPVHTNIVVDDNAAQLSGSSFFTAKSTANIKLLNNRIRISAPIKEFDKLLNLKDCTNVNITNNQITIVP